MTDKTATLTVRIPHSAAHYEGNLVSGAKIMELFGDAATEILLKHDGQEGLFRAYESVDFLAPVHGGDFIEVKAHLISVGNSSRKISFEAHKINGQRILVAKAVGTCVVKN